MADSIENAETGQTSNPPHGIGAQRAGRNPANGRFVPGNRCAVGRKRRKRVRGVAALMRALESELTPAKATELVQGALVHLARGNVGPFASIVNAARMVQDDELAARLDELEKRLDSAHGGGVAGRLNARAA